MPDLMNEYFNQEVCAPLEGSIKKLETLVEIHKELSLFHKKLVAISNTRSVIHSNKSSSLFDTLEESCSHISNNILKIKFKKESIPALDSIQIDVIINCIQEACNNALKHAKCRHLYINSQVISNQLVLIISDDGSYIEDKVLPEKSLKTIEIRLKSIKGHYEHSHRPESGFCIKLIIPIAPKKINLPQIDHNKFKVAKNQALESLLSQINITSRKNLIIVNKTTFVLELIRDQNIAFNDEQLLIKNHLENNKRFKYLVFIENEDGTTFVIQQSRFWQTKICPVKFNDTLMNESIFTSTQITNFGMQLHDSTCQILVALASQLTYINNKKRLSLLEKKNITSLKISVEQLLAKTRSLSHSLLGESNNTSFTDFIVCKIDSLYIK